MILRAGIDTEVLLTIVGLRINIRATGAGEIGLSSGVLCRLILLGHPAVERLPSQIWLDRMAAYTCSTREHRISLA